MKDAVFCDVTPCGSCKNRRFKGTFCLHQQGEKNQRARNRVNIVRFDVFTAVTMMNGVFWDVTPCGSCTDVSEEYSGSIIGVTRIVELGT
jgi:cytidine deaminase